MNPNSIYTNHVTLCKGLTYSMLQYPHLQLGVLSVLTWKTWSSSLAYTVPVDEC